MNTATKPAQGPAGAIVPLLDQIDELRAQLAHERAMVAELVAALREVQSMLSEHPEAKQGNSKVHYLMHAARAALARAKEVQQ